MHDLLSPLPRAAPLLPPRLARRRPPSTLARGEPSPSSPPPPSSPLARRDPLPLPRARPAMAAHPWRAASARSAPASRPALARPPPSPAMACPTTSSSACSPSLSCQMRQITIHPPQSLLVDAYGRALVRKLPGRLRCTSTRLSNSGEHGRRDDGSDDARPIRLRWSSAASGSKSTTMRS